LVGVPQILKFKNIFLTYAPMETLNCSGESIRREMSMDDPHIIGSQRKLTHTLASVGVESICYNEEATPHETIKAKPLRHCP